MVDSLAGELEGGGEVLVPLQPDVRDGELPAVVPRVAGVAGADGDAVVVAWGVRGGGV